jgi:hypothetical protein
MLNTTLNLATLSIRERLALVEERFDELTPKVYDDTISEREGRIYDLLFKLIAYYQDRLSDRERLLYSWGY